MKTRITITLDPAAHRQARQTARLRKTTVSGLIEHLLLSPRTTGPATSLVDQMVGSATLRQSAPGRDPLFDALKAKHLGPTRA